VKFKKYLLFLLFTIFINNVWSQTNFYFGGTSLLIIVVVTMDFMTQVQSHLMSHQYEGLLKKANFKGGAGAR
jgi:preprotein translocase subunit SecY